jgi:hypothetical protein
MEVDNHLVTGLPFPITEEEIKADIEDLLEISEEKVIIPR